MLLRRNTKIELSKLHYKSIYHAKHIHPIIDSFGLCSEQQTKLNFRACQRQNRKIYLHIATHKKHKPLAIYIMPYHLHFLIGPNLNKSISDLIKEIKHSSNWFINDNYLTKQKFSLQESYGAFSYSKSALNNIVQYILNQKKHHKKQTFKKEYIQFLLKFEIDYEAKYLFEFYD